MKRLKGGVQSGIRCFRVYYLKYLIGLATVESDAHFLYMRYVTNDITITKRRIHAK